MVRSRFSRVPAIMAATVLATAAVTPAAQSATISIAPADDAFRTCLSNGSCGISRTGLLRWGRFGTGQFLSLFIEFDLGVLPAGSTIDAARIWLVPTGPAATVDNLSLYNGQDGVITFTDPTSGFLGIATFDFRAGTGAFATVTAAASAFYSTGGRYLGVFDNCGTCAVQDVVSSRSPDPSLRPYLEVTYSVVPVPAAGSLLLAALSIGAGLSRRRPADSFSPDR